MQCVQHVCVPDGDPGVQRPSQGVPRCAFCSLALSQRERACRVHSRVCLRSSCLKSIGCTLHPAYCSLCISYCGSTLYEYVWRADIGAEVIACSCDTKFTHLAWYAPSTSLHATPSATRTRTRRSRSHSSSTHCPESAQSFPFRVSA